jgi:hypothetical protein
MDDIFDSPTTSSSIRYQDVRSAIVAGIRLEMRIPNIFMFRNVRRMTVEDLDRFDPTDPLTSNDEEFDGSSIESSQIKQRKVRAANSYFYKIGEYASSTYYRQFLSDKLVRTPSGCRIAVRHMTDQISHMPKSTFRAWFRMPLFKVVKIADRYPKELSEIMKCYEEVGLPGAVGSLDVVHVKWSNCPAGDHNRA